MCRLFYNFIITAGHAAGTQTNRPFSVGDQLYYQSEDSLYGGGGVQYLCMPPNMQWNKYDTTPGDYAAFAWVSLRLRFRFLYHRRRGGLDERRAVIYNSEIVSVRHQKYVKTSEWQCYTDRLVLTWRYYTSLAVSVSWLKASL